MEHKKALYYDGHEWPNVVDYCQNSFLPLMAEINADWWNMEKWEKS